MNWRKCFSGIAAAAAIGILILDSHTAFVGASEGMNLCLRTVIPSLFPFLYLSNVLISAFSEYNLPILYPLARFFHFPHGSEVLLIPSFLGGYPIGAQSISAAFRSGWLDRQSAENLLAYGSNIGPAFLFGVLAFQFSKIRTLWAIWCIQLLSAWTVSCLFTAREAVDSKGIPAKRSVSPLDSAIRAAGKISGWIILFRILIAFLDRWFLWMVPGIFRAAVVSFLELSNGSTMLNTITDEGKRFVLANGMLAFGGLCVVFQTTAVCGSLKIRNYLYGKCLQMLTAAALSIAYWNHLWYIAIPYLAGAVAFSQIRRVNKSK